jgi:hypothetical protein
MNSSKEKPMGKNIDTSVCVQLESAFQEVPTPKYKVFCRCCCCWLFFRQTRVPTTPGTSLYALLGHAVPLKGPESSAQKQESKEEGDRVVRQHPQSGWIPGKIPKNRGSPQSLWPSCKNRVGWRHLPQPWGLFSYVEKNSCSGHWAFLERFRYNHALISCF